MINEFKVGYYYKWIGNEDKYYWDDETKIILDRKWYKCIHGHRDYAQFEEMKEGYYWLYKDFIESKYSPRYKVKKLLEEI